MDRPASLAPKQPKDGASATQLSILLTSATSIIDEEFKRSERVDAKSRNQIALVASFFAVTQAGVIALLDGALGAHEHHAASSFVPWLAGVAIIAAAAITGAVFVSYRAWRLFDDPTLAIKTIRAYRDAAVDGNPAVGAKLVEAYAEIAEGRRDNNKKRTDALERATKACAVSVGCVAVELAVAFVAVAVH